MDAFIFLRLRMEVGFVHWPAACQIETTAYAGKIVAEGVRQSEDGNSMMHPM